MGHSKIELCVDQASFSDKLVINNGLSRKTCSADLDLMKQCLTIHSVLHLYVYCILVTMENNMRP